MRQVLENLSSLRHHLDSSDLARQDQEIRRAFVMRYLHFKRSGMCMVPECHARSVSRSHAISCAASLSLIAENGHVVAPTVSYSTTTVKVKKTGLRAASTFPGFCREHELMFRSFEQARRLRSAADWSRQFFRTACWEMRTLDYAVWVVADLLYSRRKTQTNLWDGTATPNPNLLGLLGLTCSNLSKTGHWRQDLRIILLIVPIDHKRHTLSRDRLFVWASPEKPNDIDDQPADDICIGDRHKNFSVGADEATEKVHSHRPEAVPHKARGNH